ncbi:hypothetical protein SAMN06298226_2309 [Nitrosovibrio sp. Nv4]|nr:hypothetical protein SAMN06298226_2309 [Nitrosovibrio sp. Nv4]
MDTACRFHFQTRILRDYIQNSTGWNLISEGVCVWMSASESGVLKWDNHRSGFD